MHFIYACLIFPPPFSLGIRSTRRFLVFTRTFYATSPSVLPLRPPILLSSSSPQVLAVNHYVKPYYRRRPRCQPVQLEVDDFLFFSVHLYGFGIPAPCQKKVEHPSISARCTCADVEGWASPHIHFMVLSYLSSLLFPGQFCHCCLQIEILGLPMIH